MAEENGERKALAMPPTSNVVESGGGGGGGGLGNKHRQSNTLTKSRRRCCVFCGGCTLVILVVIAIAMLVLALTVYKVRGPQMRINSITILRGDGTTTTIVVDGSVKNPNPVAYYFSKTKASFYYKGLVFGVAEGPSGTAEAHQTNGWKLRMTVPTNKVASMVLNGGQLVSGDVVPIDSETKVGGHVKILGLVKHHVDVVMNCTVAVAVENFTILHQRCWQRVWI